MLPGGLDYLSFKLSIHLYIHISILLPEGLEYALVLGIVEKAFFLQKQKNISIYLYIYISVYLYIYLYTIY